VSWADEAPDAAPQTDEACGAVAPVSGS
jgi:hypothetical protein